MSVVIYSTGCPRCKVLKKKLSDKGIKFDEVSDEAKMEALGIESVPVLSVDGTLLEFHDANEWINNY